MAIVPSFDNSSVADGTCKVAWRAAFRHESRRQAYGRSFHIQELVADRRLARGSAFDGRGVYDSDGASGCSSSQLAVHCDSPLAEE